MPALQLPDDIETQYNPRKAVPDVERFVEWAAQRSEVARARHHARLDLRYGRGALATLDVFPAGTPDAPIHVFLHGGYWRGRDKRDYSYVADALVPQGITTVVMNYDLCPAVELPFIVQQVREALQWIHAHARELGGNPGAISVSGHSAGAHLIAAALPPADAPQPALAWLPQAAVLISGIYELQPVLSISVNQEIRLRAELVDAMSPMRHLPTTAVPLTVVVGGGETREWIRQSHDFAHACAARGTQTAYVELPGLHHYSIMSPLEAPHTLLARIIGAVARPVPAAAPAH